MSLQEQTAEKISRYANATMALQQAEARKRSAECELSNATNDLIKYLLPKKPDEREAYCIWVDGGGPIALGKGQVLLRISKKEHRDWALDIIERRNE